MKIKITIAVIVALAVGFFAGMEYKAYQIRTAIDDAVGDMVEAFSTGFSDPDPSPVVAEAVADQNQTSNTFVDAEVGELVQLATLDFTVNTVTEKQTVVGTFGSPAIAKNGAKFALLDISIINKTDGEFDFDADDGFRLINERGREFTEYDQSIGAIKNYLSWRSLAPGITENGILIYELPADVTSYYWTVGKGGTDEIYRVKLK